MVSTSCSFDGDEGVGFFELGVVVGLWILGDDELAEVVRELVDEMEEMHRFLGKKKRTEEERQGAEVRFKTREGEREPLLLARLRVQSKLGGLRFLQVEHALHPD